MKDQEKNIVDPAKRDAKHQPDSIANREHTDVKKLKKNQGIPNSGGQTANETDNKQSNVNRGNQSSEKRGKEN
ncbi:hypothetical protein [Albibacterium indicum]|uniref:hypothetical protein n=1 Tax=Albibacterium indicum TaxID=2292082 RepID=UPI000E4855DD|nr:hypothetical protein [Pedobacter indicus]